MDTPKIGSINSWDQIETGKMFVSRNRGKRRDTFKYDVELNGKKLTVWVSYIAADSHNLKDVQKKLFDTMQKIRKLQPAYKFGDKVSSITFRSSQKEGPKVELTYAKGYKPGWGAKGAKVEKKRWVKPIHINKGKVNSYMKKVKELELEIRKNTVQLQTSGKSDAEISKELEPLHNKRKAAEAKHQVYSTMLKVSLKTTKSTRNKNKRGKTKYTAMPIPPSIDSGAKVADWDAVELNFVNPLIKMRNNRSGTIQYETLPPKTDEKIFDELIEELEQEQG